MSALIRLRDAGLSVRLDNGEVVVEGLDRLPLEVAGPLLDSARACREGIRIELTVGPCSDSAAALAQAHARSPHLVCCPKTTPPWWLVERSWCETKCQTPCGNNL